MQKKQVLTVFLGAVLLVLAGCSGSGVVYVVSPGPGSNQSAPVNLTLRDDPPSGVTVLAFKLTVMSAVLQPGNVSLLEHPVDVEIKQLEVESALLNTIDAPAGNYTSIDVMVSNPELTIKNDTGAPLPSDATCLNGAICKLDPPIAMGQSKVSVMFSPALNLMADTPIGLELDLNLAGSIPSSLANITPMFKVTQLAVVQGTHEIKDFDELVGMVTAKDATMNTFTIQPSEGGNPVNLTVNGDTRFRDFDEAGCKTADFNCVATGQLVAVRAKLMDSGMILATKVSLENEDQNPEELRGILVAISGANQFQIVVLDEQPHITNIDVGHALTVNVLPGTNFSVQQGDSDGLDISGLSFGGMADLVVGQFLQIKPHGPSTGPAAGVDADAVRLKMSSVTGTVKAAPTTSNFTINNLPKLFTDAMITEIDVRGAAAEVEEGGAITSLKAGDTVSVEGLLFHTMSGNPVMVAQKIRKRQSGPQPG
jgi:hypothetical protein